MILFVVVLLSLAQLMARRWGPLATRARAILPDWGPWPGAVLLCAGFAAQLAVVRYAAQYDRFGDHRWLERLPMHLAYFGPTAHTHAHAMVETGIAVSVTLQLLGLIAVAFSPESRMTRALPVVTAVVLAVLAIFSTVLTSADVFYYAYASTVGLETYTQTTVPAESPYHFLLPRIPLVGNIYGPLWTQLDAFIGSFGTTLHDKIIALRLANTCFVLAATLAIRALRFPRRVQIAFGLNPMLWFYFVVNAHNDIMMIALCLLALASARRYPAIAIALVAAAGAMKISYLLIGCLAFARLRSPVRVVGAAAAAVLGAVIVSWALAGHGYFSNLASYAQTVAVRPDLNQAFFKSVSLTISVAVVLLTAAALLGRRFVWATPWLYPLAAPLPYAWYLVWGIPYAALARRGFAATLLLLPIGAALADYVFGMQDVASALMVVVVAAGAVGIVAGDVRRRFA